MQRTFTCGALSVLGASIALTVLAVGCSSESAPSSPAIMPAQAEPDVSEEASAGIPSTDISRPSEEPVLPDELAGEGAGAGVQDAPAPGVTDATDASAPPPAATVDAAVFPPAQGTPSIFLAGDSTVQTYGAAQAPQQGWGQRLPEFFTSDVVIVNRAIGGRSSKSYIDEGRLDDVLNEIGQGDYLFAQWGINDRYRSDPTRFTDPATTFKQYLSQYIEGARSKNAIPVLVTPTPRLNYVDNQFRNDFEAYCTAIKELGSDTGTTVIDLQTKGLAYYTSIGIDEVEATISLDVLHFKTEGAYQMARLVAEGVAESNLPIAAFVK